MSRNEQKTPLVLTLNALAQRKALDAISLLGKALPASVVAVSGSIVTVKFEVQSTFTLPNVTCPMFGPEYIRYPTRVGDLGAVFPADAYLGGMSGLGGGVADLSLQANLSALVFFPIASKNWSATDNPNALLLYAPDGTILRTIAKDSVLTVATGVIRLKALSIVFDGPVTFENTVTGTGGVVDFGSSTIHAGPITSNGKDVGSTHEHSGVQTGGGNTGPPV